MEYINRVDYLSKQTLHEENKETTVSQEINKLLIYNLLPKEIGNFKKKSEKNQALDFRNSILLFCS